MQHAETESTLARVFRAGPDPIRC